MPIPKPRWTPEVLPGVAAFAAQTSALETTALADCTPGTLRAPWNAAFDGLLGIAHLGIGPLGGTAALPSSPSGPTRGTTPRMLSQLIAAQDPTIETEAGVADLPVAARGLFMLEWLTDDPRGAGGATMAVR